MAVVSARELFAGLRPQAPAGLRASYRFDLGPAGTWRLEVAGGSVSVEESGAPADCVVATNEETLLAIVNGEQDPLGAYMTGKVRVEGELGLALRLRELLA